MAERSSSRGTAPDRIRRILYLLPAAGTQTGASMDELCDALGVTPDVLLADMAEVTAREYYLPAGRGDSLRITVDADRVRVWTTGEFRRPPRLTAREALALGLGLRVLAGERADEDRAGLIGLARRLEAGFASVSEIEFAPDFALADASGAGPGAGADDPAAPSAGSDAALRGLLLDAARERRVCAFDYLKAGAARPERRRVEPYVLVASSGRWYVVGHDPDRDDVRAFRLDRMLEAACPDERFTPDPEFDLERYLTGAYVYRAPDGGAGAPATAPAGSRARVRYSPAIARWILERESGEALEDGAAVVEHVVGDPAWAARHILQYGGDAELLGPADLRARVAAGARKAEAVHAGRAAALRPAPGSPSS